MLQLTDLSNFINEVIAIEDPHGGYTVYIDPIQMKGKVYCEECKNEFEAKENAYFFFIAFWEQRNKNQNDKEYI